MLLAKLISQIEAELRFHGRDQSRIRLALRRLLLKLELSTTVEAEWEPEYRDWLITSFCEALTLCQARAVEREDYEQAAEIRTLLLDVQTLEEEGIITS